MINSNGSVWKITTSKPSTDFTLTTDTPTRTGHTFLGWATTADTAVAEYKPGDTITADTKDMNLYAVWKKTTYIKTKKVNGIFMVTPTGIPVGSSIMLACYKNGVLVHIGKFEYDGSATVPFFVNEDYDEVKVLVWSDVGDMVPVTEAEDVNL